MTSPMLQRLETQLARLEEQVREHDAQLTPADKKWLANQSAFHDQLFDHQGASLSSCLQVLRQDLKQIQQLEQLGARPDAVELVCHRFANRFSAVAQALANTAVMRRGHQTSALAGARRNAKKTNNEYHWIARSVMRSSHQLYDELRKHQNWADRLEQKIRELEQRLDLHQGADKITLQNEILATHKRLGRCRQAMTFIEQRIAHLEKPGRGSF
ncbi:primosomal replication protein [Ferrimonas balearica]|uniref:primosomal replication protein n=1 Tax=Ferrimonas balearica TaxID=44012 RepID=UPI001C58A389|nr:primosomal replication protein [Ferrimonas balearica]MBW3164171.1 primosomal replication protein [Ferrimonas balearica]